MAANAQAQTLMSSHFTQIDQTMEKKRHFRNVTILDLKKPVNCFSRNSLDMSAAGEYRSKYFDGNMVYNYFGIVSAR